MKNLHNNEKGSFTIEATLVFPLLLLITIFLLFFAMFAYESASLHQKTALIVDRTAYNWNHTTADHNTGAYSINENESLYWRTTNDSILDVFQFMNDNKSTTIQMPVEQLIPKAGVERKLQQAGTVFSKEVKGELSYTNHLISRAVKIQAYQKTVIPATFRKWGRQGYAAARSTSQVSDPVEFIRNTELVRTYIGRLKERTSSQEVTGTIQDMIPATPKPKVIIRSETDASSYIRKLVGGERIYIPTEELGKTRLIDAMDPDGIAHEVKYTVNVTEARQQLLKDVELMRTGKVKGVVWHFFRHAKTGKLDLSASLRRDLEKKGIVIVVHN